MKLTLYNIHFLLADFMVSIRTDGSSIIGENLTLTCYAMTAENVSGDINLQWIGPDGEQVISTESVAIGVPVRSGLVTSLILQFTDLRTSNGGQYTCLVSNGEAQSVSVTTDVIVQSMSQS